MELKVWPSDLVQMKNNKKKISMVTAYDFFHAQIVDQAGVDAVLVGDSLGNVIAGMENTLSVTLDQMVYHAQIVARSIQRALLIVDMPYMTYHINPEKTVENAGFLIQKGGAQAVKLEGGKFELDKTLSALKKAQIPFIGHLGLTPQSINVFGGYKVQGRDQADYQRLKNDAEFLSEAGAFAIVLEGMPENLAKEITESVSIPTIGIGAGRYTDGQVLVLHDLLGYSQKTPRFVRKYDNFYDKALQAVKNYVDDVKKNDFPNENEIYK